MLSKTFRLWILVETPWDRPFSGSLPAAALRKFSPESDIRRKVTQRQGYECHWQNRPGRTVVSGQRSVASNQFGHDFYWPLITNHGPLIFYLFPLLGVKCMSKE